ncbi:MAG TPA: hypothetical protein VGL40_13390 [Bacillota bacterium]|jgi:hypothetical protein
MERLQSIDRRWIYLLLALVVVIALLNPIGLPVKVGNTTRTMFEAVDALPPGSVIWIGMDFNVSSKAEQFPMVSVLLDHAFQKNLKVVGFAMWPNGGQIFKQLVEPVAKKYKKVEGTDFLNIGYKPGNGVALRAMVTDVNNGAAGVDHNGKPITSSPLGQQVKRLTAQYVNFVVDIAAGDPGTVDYLNFVATPEKIPMATAVVNVSVPQEMPYVQSGQYKGLMGGLRGAAEYEILAKAVGKAAAGMDSQSLAAVLITLFIVVGNVGYLATRGKK